MHSESTVYFLYCASNSNHDSSSLLSAGLPLKN